MKKLLWLVLAAATFAPAQTFDTQAQQAKDAIQSLDAAAEARVAADQQAIATANANTTAVQGKLDTATAQIINLQASLKSAPGAVLGDLQKFSWSAGLTGPAIGAVAPKSFSWQHTDSGALLLSVEGYPKQWTDWLTAIHIYNGLSDSTNKIALDFQLSTSSNTLQYAQALEIDLITVSKGLKYNLSSQIDYSRGGVLQISQDVLDASGNYLKTRWVDAGVTVGKLTPDVPHAVRWEYLIDRDNKTYRYVAFTLDGVRYPVNVALKPPIPTTWRDQLCVQLQQDVNSKCTDATCTQGGSFTETFDNMKLTLF